MPFPYETAGQPVRVRKSKDKDSRSTTSSSGGRKQRHASDSSNRSPPQSDRSTQLSIYTQENSTLDQLPALPESGTASPGSAASPVLKESSIAHVPNPTPILYHHTPLALQKYLQTDEEEEQEQEREGSDREPYQKRQLESRSGTTIRTESESRTRAAEIRSDILDSHTSTPLATSVREYPESTYDHSDPSFFSQPRTIQRSVSSRSSTSRSSQDRPYKVSSPPPPPSLPPSISQAPSNQSAFDVRQPQRQPQFEYRTNPSPFAPVVPFNTGAPSELYFPSAYPTPQHYPMLHPTDRRADIPQFPPHSPSPYLQYGGPVHSQDLADPIHPSPSRGHNSANLRMSAGAEPIPVAHFAASSSENQPLLDSPGLPKQSTEDDPAELLHRIQGAIPDLHLLLNRHREISDQLGMREQLMKDKEAQRSAELKQKEDYIEKLRQELDDVKSKYSAESSKLRLEIGNMEEKHKEIQERALAEQKAKEAMEIKNRDQAAEMARIAREHNEDSARLTRDLDAWKRKASQDASALRDDLQRQRQDLEMVSQTELGRVARIHAQEKEALHSTLAQCRKEMEAHSQGRQAIEKVADTRQKDLEDSRRQHAEEKHSWERERQTMNRRWDEERVALGKGSEEQRKILVAQHESEKEDIRKSQERSEARLRKQVQEDAVHLQDEVGRLKDGWDADKTKFSRVTADLKASAARLDEENQRLQRLANAFGEVTDLRSRGDPFYQDAFKLLEKQINDLAIEDFADTLEDPHQEATLAMARVIPSSPFPTVPSAQLRMGYVEHTISAIITRRIFKPFLFVLSDRLRSADQLFVEMSQNIKRKSTRREALWRQRTLHAAFTAESAKRSINRIATRIVDEIIDAVKPFANRARWQHITATVRSIVKTAAETWRYARLESPLIIASMDQSDIIQAFGTEATQRPDLNHTSKPGRRVLLSLFPTIRREARHESLQDESKLEDHGCVYSSGRLLYADDAKLLSYGADSSLWHEAKVSPRSSSNSYHSIEMVSVNGSRPQSPLIPPSTTPKPMLADQEQDMSHLNANPHGRRESRTDKPASVSRIDSVGLATEGDKEEISKGSGTPSRHSSPRSSVSVEKSPSEDKAHAASIPDWGGAGGSPLVMGNAAEG